MRLADPHCQFRQVAHWRQTCVILLNLDGPTWTDTISWIVSFHHLIVAPSIPLLHVIIMWQKNRTLTQRRLRHIARMLYRYHLPDEGYSYWTRSKQIEPSSKQSQLSFKLSRMTFSPWSSYKELLPGLHEAPRKWSRALPVPGA